MAKFFLLPSISISIYSMFKFLIDADVRLGLGLHLASWVMRAAHISKNSMVWWPSTYKKGLVVLFEL